MAEGEKLRVDSIDLLRGLAMIVMALDHVRDFFTNAHFDPTDVTKTTPAYYATRFVTHFCAPTFVFLAGTSAFMQLTRGKAKPVLARFLVTRGLWLVLLELTLVRFGWSLNLDYHFVGVQVIWALGWSMVALAPLVLLPPSVTAAIGLAIVALHDLTDGMQSSSWLWHVLHDPGVILLPGQHRLFIVYPLVPWVGVMAAGFGFGKLIEDPGARRKRLLRLGAHVTLLFIAVRGSNMYGDPHPWSPQGSFGATLGAFLNCEKYPPSLSFLLMTLGPAIALLAPLERFRGPVASVVRTFGRVPLFYYLLHVLVIHLLAVVLAAVRYGHFIGGMLALPFNWHVPSGYGYSLPVVYLLWAFVVAGLFPLCRWFERVKQRSKSPWLSYL
jgi:uncharacterized membrane protein